MQTTRSRRRFSVRKMAVVGMLSGISIFMGLTGLGFIPFAPAKLTIMHLPVIIGAIIEGPVVGALVGLVFGLFSMYQAVVAPTPISPLFYNPIVSLVPRILIGIVAYYVYVFLKDKFKKQSVAISVSAILATLTNTLGVLGFIYIFFIDKYAQLMEISTNAVAGVLGTVVLTNGVPEALLAGFITVPVVQAIKRLKN